MKLKTLDGFLIIVSCWATIPEANKPKWARQKKESKNMIETENNSNGII